MSHRPNKNVPQITFEPGKENYARLATWAAAEGISQEALVNKIIGEAIVNAFNTVPELEIAHQGLQIAAQALKDNPDRTIPPTQESPGC